MPDIRSKDPRVALISMPTLHASTPFFQQALLKPTLEREGIPTQVFSMYLYFAAHIGWQINDSLAEVRSCLAGEWIWSPAAFGEFGDQEAYLRRYQRSLADLCEQGGCTLDYLLDIRHRKVPSFLDFCVRATDWERFSVIGFSIVFQQMTASLALARRLKERYPHIPIILGGATFEDDIGEGIMEGCPWVDYVHCGDGDVTFPEFVKRLHRGEAIDDLRGVMWRRDGELQFAGRAPNFTDMASTPIPDFDEYFYARKESGYSAYGGATEPLLPIETARGCWWGEKHHCTFCGLNRSGMEFRSKSPEQVLEMLDSLASRYGVFHFDAIDNIMDPKYMEGLFGFLAESSSDIRIHYEVRPYMNRRQMRDLWRGGLFSVQPGVESLSTHVLDLMKKKSTGVRNVAFMKWCTYYGVRNLYNILMGFAGETAEDYEQQCATIRKIPHLEPPWGITHARADRGSPMYAQAAEHGVKRLRPMPCYPDIFPEDRCDLNKVAYYFQHDQEDILEDEAYEPIYTLVAEWQKRWRNGPRPRLRYYKSWRAIVIEDARNGAPRKSTHTGREAKLYEMCEEPSGLGKLVRAFDGDQEWVTETLDRFVKRDLILHLDNRYLSLALPARVR